LREQFIFREDGIEDNEEINQEKMDQLKIAPIKQFVNKIEQIPDDCHQKNKRIQQMIQNKKEKDILELVDFLTIVTT